LPHPGATPDDRHRANQHPQHLSALGASRQRARKIVESSLVHEILLGFSLRWLTGRGSDSRPTTPDAQNDNLGVLARVVGQKRSELAPSRSIAKRKDVDRLHR